MSRHKVEDRLVDAIFFVMVVFIGFMVMALSRNGLQLLIEDAGLGSDLAARLMCFIVSFFAATMVMSLMFKSWRRASAAEVRSEN